MSLTNVNEKENAAATTGEGFVPTIVAFCCAHSSAAPTALSFADATPATATIRPVTTMPAAV